MEEIAKICELAAREAGQILLEMQSKIVAREKAPADLVTEADLAAQAKIQGILGEAFPEFGFFGEESTEDDRVDFVPSDNIFADLEE